MLEIEYDPLLVGVSIAVAIWGSWTSLVLTFGLLDERKPMSQIIAQCINCAAVMGGSIWAMHFIAMLAVKFPTAISYNMTETVASLLLAITVCGLGLFVASQNPKGLPGTLTGGALIGLGIAGMHYLGVSAIRGCGLTFHLLGTLGSVAIAVLAACAALWFAMGKRGLAETMIGGVIMGMAISAMHFIGMYATTFVSTPTFVAVAQSHLSHSILAYAIAMAAFAVCSAQLLMATGSVNKAAGTFRRGY
ncbi:MULTISPECIES: MHYT domain-containing protein [Filomicrobium]|uniref:MHYT domain-containing protein, NO-binding membrane sensor n=2 Tax=Filomicrobium TaxID=119044 RepID=A0A1H0J6Y8_9HYPH|nr:MULTISPECIES: MHYT domain-containing protein [Filomicrobium]MCV0368446.1 hypothetical protein [Filomicrobium sp.]SDO39392.1 MHYT domain-containing protein, NO-binding membrane sensor [Filomicrobium insigne]